MNSLEWFATTRGGDSENAAAKKIGLTQSTINRQVARGHLSPEVVVAVARAYRAPVLPGLVACGLITAEEAALKERALSDVLDQASDADLLQAVLRRVDGDGNLAHPILTQPISIAPDAQVLATYQPGGKTDRERFRESLGDDGEGSQVTTWDE